MSKVLLSDNLSLQKVKVKPVNTREEIQVSCKPVQETEIPHFHFPTAMAQHSKVLTEEFHTLAFGRDFRDTEDRKDFHLKIFFEFQILGDKIYNRYFVFNKVNFLLCFNLQDLEQWWFSNYILQSLKGSCF